MDIDKENRMMSDDIPMDAHIGKKLQIKKLCMAAREGDLEELKKLLKGLPEKKRTKWLNKFDKDQHTPLHYAARYNNKEVVDYLMKAGADIKSEDRDRATPLHYAARYKPLETEQDCDTPDGGGDVTDGPSDDMKYCVSEEAERIQDDIIDQFISEGVDINTEDKHGLTPLHLAAMKGNTRALKKLLSIAKIDLQARDKQGMTPLHQAALHEQAEAARILINAGAQITVKGGVLGSSPLHVACTEGSTDIVRELLAADKKVNEKIVHRTDRDHSTPLHRAVEGGYLEIAQECIRNGAKIDAMRTDGTVPLHLAAKSGNKAVVELLLEKGAMIDVETDQAETPLFKAAAKGHYKICYHLLTWTQQRKPKINARNKDGFTPLLKAAKKGHSKTVRLLLSKRAEVRATDKNDRSAVYFAASENNLDVLKCLLSDRRVMKAGMINASSYCGNSPLHIAASKGYVQIVQHLLDKGAYKLKKNEREQTALHLACKNGQVDVIKVLLGIDEDLSDDDEDEQQSCATLLNDEDEQGCTPLHLAANEGQVRAVEVLIYAGADIDNTNADERTPLHLASLGGWSRTANILLTNGCPVDPCDIKDKTPLHLAAAKGNDPVVKLLLEHNADVGLADKSGCNSLDLAIDKGHKHVARTIISSDKWKDAMKNARKTRRRRDELKDSQPMGDYSMLMTNRAMRNMASNNFYDTPMRKLIRKMPDVAEEVFSRCCDLKGKDPSDRNCQIEYTYEFLDDAYLLQHWVKNEADDMGNSSSTTAVTSYNFKTKKLLPSADPYTRDVYILTENHPLQIMVTSKRQDLLDHPLVTALLRQKWKTGRLLYYVNLSVYLFFIFFLTGYIVDDTGRHPYQHFDMSKLSVYNGSECERMAQYVSDAGMEFRQTAFSEVCKYACTVLALVIGIREIVQMFQGSYLYFMNYINYIEWTIIISTLLLCLDFDNPCQRVTGYRLAWQWQMSGIAIFWAWLDLVLFMRKVPIIGIYSVMFTDVLKTFIRFFPLLFMLATAFGLSFHALLGNQFPFRTMLSSLVKTFTMMTGDLDYTVIAHEPYTSDRDVQYWYNFISTAQFILFIVIMIIIVMNLLIGLAVDDIKTVQEQAALKRRAMQVELTLSFEGMLVKLRHSKGFCGLLGKFFTSTIGETLKVNKPRKWYRKLFLRDKVSASRIARALLNDPETAEQDRLAEQVDNIEYRVKDMENMLKALLKHHDIKMKNKW